MPQVLPGDNPFALPRYGEGTDFSGAVLGGNAEAFFQRYRQRASDAVSELYSLERDCETLFILGDRLLARHAASPFSSLVIEETGAHFIGVFVQRLLGFAAGDTFLIKPDYKSPAALSRFYEGIETVAAEGGSRPLILSEMLTSGTTAAFFASALAARGLLPTYAALFYDGRQFVTARAPLLAAGQRADAALSNHSASIVAELLCIQGVRAFTCTLPQCDALNSIPVPAGARCFLEQSLHDRWLAEASNSADLQAREQTIEFALSCMDELLEHYSASRSSSFPESLPRTTRPN